ncbi:MAG: hypothetical protein IPL62_10425 [Caulobacteraceae bacterium]|nr:hypothetical protein [Caulobacteraceae bacterium]
MADVPQFFRMNLEVSDLAAAQSFYEALFGVQGRGQPGHRFYINPGPVSRSSRRPIRILPRRRSTSR